ncbi:MAG: TIGR04282 family arsenosugar biosynthesis glycosyltransferase [Vicinamibacterales bacterium]
MIAVMARAPSSEGKSRLIRDLGTNDGARLRLALLRDTLESVSALAADKAVLHTPPDREAEIRAVTPFDAIFLAQRGSTLGERMHEGASDLLSSGFDAVVLIGSDLPTLPPAHISAAVDTLSRRGEVLVLGPAEDGGYYLIGLSQSRPEFFEHIPWGTPLVLQRTREAAEAIGIPVEAIPLWYDVDSASDLRRVWHRADQPDGAARYTRAWLAASPSSVRARVAGETR